MNRLIVTALALCFAVVSSVALGEGGAQLSPKELFEARCGACHPTDKAVALPKDAKVIEANIKKMQAKRPDVITNAEAKIVVEYLLSLGK